MIIVKIIKFFNLHLHFQSIITFINFLILIMKWLELFWKSILLKIYILFYLLCYSTLKLLLINIFYLNYLLLLRHIIRNPL